MLFGCCINLGSFVPQVAGEAKAATTPATVAAAMSFLKETGFDFAEFTVGLAMNPPGGDFAALLDVVRESGLPVDAFNSFIPAQLPLVGPARDLGAIRAYVADACARVSQLGGKIVVFGSGGARRVPAGYDFDAAQAELVEFLHLVADAAEPHGITVVVEPLNKKETNIIHTVGDGLALAQRVNRSGIGALADTYHMDMEGEPVEVLTSVAARISHVHVADTERRAPGTGTYDYARLRRCLEAGGYKGRVSIECRWDDFKAEAPAALATLRQAWQ